MKMGGRPSKPERGNGLVSRALAAEDALDDGGVLGRAGSLWRSTVLEPAGYRAWDADLGHEPLVPLVAALLTFPSDASPLMSESCTRRDHRQVFPGQDAGIGTAGTPSRQSRELLTCSFFARLMQFPRLS
jgi:hypothetical protein